MNVTVNLEKLMYGLDGDLASFKKGKNLEKLTELGCREVLPGQEPSFLICGPHAGAKKLEAQAIGVPIVKPSQVRKALKSGELELPYIRDHDDAQQLFGPARSLFDGPLSSEKWTQFLALAECCLEDQCEPFMMYILRGLEESETRDEKSTSYRWEPDPSHPLTGVAKRNWSDGNPFGELCVAPPAWLHEMFTCHKGHRPKHALVRAVNLHRMGLLAEDLIKILTNPYLKNVRFLNLGYESAHLTNHMLRSLSTYPIMENLETLHIYDIKASMLNALRANPKGSLKIKHLRFFGCLQRYNDTEHYKSMSKDQGESLVANIQGLDCFETPPKITFHSVKALPFNPYKKSKKRR